MTQFQRMRLRWTERWGIGAGPSLWLGLAGIAVAALVALGLALAQRAGGVVSQVEGAAGGPRIRSAELRYATTPAPGVWAELKVVLDNPLAAAAGGTALLVPESFLEEFEVRGGVPELAAGPRREVDGRTTFLFPAPISQSLNWYRVELVVRRPAWRPVPLSVRLEGLAPTAETARVAARVFYADREADPFLIVPEPLVAPVPDQGRSAFGVLVGFALALAGLAAAGLAAVFRYTER